MFSCEHQLRDGCPLLIASWINYRAPVDYIRVLFYVSAILVALTFAITSSYSLILEIGVNGVFGWWQLTCALVSLLSGAVTICVGATLLELCAVESLVLSDSGLVYIQSGFVRDDKIELSCDQITDIVLGHSGEVGNNETCLSLTVKFRDVRNNNLIASHTVADWLDPTVKVKLFSEMKAFSLGRGWTCKFSE